MEDAWKFFREIDFSDEKTVQFNIDTRDFHCSINTKKSDKKLDFSKLEKTPERFFHTAEEVKNTIERLFTESGGKAKWRCLWFSGEGNKVSINWNLKYIRIHRTDLGLIICNNQHYALNKDILQSKINQDVLHAH